MSNTEKDTPQNSKNGDTHPPLPDGWMELYDREIKYLTQRSKLITDDEKGQSLTDQQLFKEEIEQRTKILLQWKPPMKKEELEKNHSQTNIKKAQVWFTGELEKFKEELTKLNEAFETIENEIKVQKEKVKQEEAQLKSLIEEKNTNVKNKEISDKVIEDLKKKVEQAGDGPIKAHLKQKLENEMSLRNILDSDDLLVKAIDNAYSNWLKMLGGLKSISEKKEVMSIAVEIKKKEMDYLSSHQYYLMNNYINL